jgi:hypothetical protein
MMVEITGESECPIQLTVADMSANLVSTKKIGCPPIKFSWHTTQPRFNSRTRAENEPVTVYAPKLALTPGTGGFAAACLCFQLHLMRWTL